MKKGMDRFSAFDLIIIALMSALGIATKPVIGSLARIITGPLFIPGGAVAGGFYMLWMVLGVGLIKKRATATLIALVQAIMVIAIGIIGTHGIMSLLTYTFPGIMIDLVYFLLRKKGDGLIDCFIGGIVSNMTGTLLSNIVFFKLPLIPLILTLSSAALSGGLGGLIAFNIIKHFKGLNIAGFN